MNHRTPKYKAPRQPLDLTFSSPIFNFKMKDYRGPIPATVLAGLWLVAMGVLFLWLATVAFGAAFEVFGATGPSWLQSAAIMASAMILGWCATPDK